MSPHLRRARAALLAGILVAAGTNSLLAVGLDGFAIRLRDPEYGYRLRNLRRELAADPRPFGVAVGSSRPEVGLSPADFGPGPRVFNFGAPGAGPLHELVTLHRLRADGVRPGFVLLEVLPAALHSGDDLGGLLRPEQLDRRDLRLARPYSADPARLQSRWGRARVVPWTTVRLTLMSVLAPDLQPWTESQTYLWDGTDRFGWMRYPRATVTPAQRAAGFARARREYVDVLRDFRISPAPDRALRQALEYCRSRAMPAALYLMPESSEFRDLYPPSALAALDDYLNRLVREYDVPAFDARTWVPDEEFADGHHLLPAGARRLSARLGRDALRPWLAAIGSRAGR